MEKPLLFITILFGKITTMYSCVLRVNACLFVTILFSTKYICIAAELWYSVDHGFRTSNAINLIKSKTR